MDYFRDYEMKYLFFVFMLAVQIGFSSTVGEESAVSFEIARAHMVKPGQGEGMPDVEAKIRKRASLALQLAYKAMNDHHRFPETIGEPRATFQGLFNHYWETIKHDGISAYAFPRIGADLKGALDTVFKPTLPLYFDCTQASIFANYALVSYFSPAHGKNLLVDPDFLNRKSLEISMPIDELRYNYGTLGYFLRQANPDERTPFKPGDFVYFKGHPDYGNRYPKGMSRGENTFFIGYDDAGQRLYVGFGELFKSGPRTALEIQTSLAKGYFDPTKDGSFENILGTIRKLSIKKRYLQVDIIAAIEEKYSKTA